MSKGIWYAFPRTPCPYLHRCVTPIVRLAIHRACLFDASACKHPPSRIATPNSLINLPVRSTRYRIVSKTNATPEHPRRSYASAPVPASVPTQYPRTSATNQATTGLFHSNHACTYFQVKLPSKTNPTDCKRPIGPPLQPRGLPAHPLRIRALPPQLGQLRQPRQVPLQRPGDPAGCTKA